MTSASETRSGNRRAALAVLVVLLCTGLLLGRLVTASESELLTRTVDDAYYYIEVAKSLAQGDAPSFDGGLTTTTGFHPGFAVLLAAVFRLRPPADAFEAVRALLAVSASLHLLTALPIYLLVRRLARDWVAVVAACLWLANPKTLAVHSEGVESALYGLTIAVSLLLFDFTLTAARSSSAARARVLGVGAALGVSLGLAMLARTDAITLVVAALLALIVVRRRSPVLLRVVGLTLGGVVVVTLPWMIYVWQITGSIVQDSGAVKHLWREVATSQLGGLGWAKYSLLIARRYLLWSYESIPLLGLLGGLGCGVLLGAGGKGNITKHQPNTERMMALVGVVILNVLLLGAAYALFFDGVRVWYCMPAAVGGTVVVGLLLEAAVSRLQNAGRRQLAWWVGAALAVLVAGVYFEGAHDVATGPGRSAHQLYSYHAALWVRDNLPPQARVGAFNAGIWREFCGHRVINLDGVINGEVVPYLQQRQLPEYAVAKVDYVADYDYVARYFERFGRPDWAVKHLVLVKAFAGEMEGSPLVLWRVVE